MIRLFSCVLMQHKFLQILISITIFFAHVQLQNSVNKTLNTKRNITQTSKETNWSSFDESFVWKTLLSLCKYFSSNTFSQNIKYCSVAFSLLFSVA